MAIHKKCLACDRYRDDCTGKEKPCKDWEPINLEIEPAPDRKAAAVVADPPAEVEAPAELTPEDQDAEAAKQDTAPEGEETLQQKFDRIGKKRQAQVLDGIRKLGHLTSKYHRTRTGVYAYTYEWTAEEAQAIIKPIEEALETLKAELLAPDMPREHGLIEEK